MCTWRYTLNNDEIATLMPFLLLTVSNPHNNHHHFNSINEITTNFLINMKPADNYQKKNQSHQKKNPSFSPTLFIFIVFNLFSYTKRKDCIWFMLGIKIVVKLLFKQYRVFKTFLMSILF